MPQSTLRLIKRFAEYKEKMEITFVPKGLRGIYALYSYHRKNGKDKYDVVYVGMAASGRRNGIRGRLAAHYRNKGDYWTHFSIFDIWENIRDEEIAELEGLFRFIYRKDRKANRLNVQRGFKKMRAVRKNMLKDWAS